MEYIKRGKVRTPEYHAQWEDGQLIEVEVTKAVRKPAHIAREKLANAICERLYELYQPWNVIAYIADDLSKDEVKSLQEAASMMQPGNHIDNPGKWWLFTDTIIRPRGEFDFEWLNRSLTGWPQETVTDGFIMQQREHSRKGIMPNPLVFVVYGVPVNSYINPVEHKATRIQGSTTNPFVIAVDIEKLAGGYSEFQRILPTYLEAWPSVSAILLFQRELHTDKFGWTWQLYLNPQAPPLPLTMLQHFPTKGERFSKFWKYTTSGLI